MATQTISIYLDAYTVLRDQAGIIAGLDPDEQKAEVEAYQDAYQEAADELARVSGLKLRVIHGQAPRQTEDESHAEDECAEVIEAMLTSSQPDDEDGVTPTTEWEVADLDEVECAELRARAIRCGIHWSEGPTVAARVGEVIGGDGARCRSLAGGPLLDEVATVADARTETDDEHRGLVRYRFRDGSTLILNEDAGAWNLGIDGAEDWCWCWEGEDCHCEDEQDVVSAEDDSDATE